MKFFFKSIIIILSCVLVGTLLLGAVFSIPTKLIDPQVEGASRIIAQEGTYHEVTKLAVSYIDNWTDSTMLLEAMFPNGDRPFVNAMKAYRYQWNEGIPSESLVHYYESGGHYDWVEEYPNYWHGYLIFLKPLLVMFEYEQIRLLNGVMQTLASVWLCTVLWKKGLKRLIIPWLLCVCLLMPVVLAKCMQYSSCFYIMTLGSIAILKLGKDNKSRLLVFLCIGICTAYFDFLTYPIATFGVPAVFCLSAIEIEKPLVMFKRFLAAIGIWLLGYGGMWLGKFAAGSLITGENMFTQSMGHVLYWVGNGARFSIPYVLYYNVRHFSYTVAMIPALIYAIVLLVTAIKKNRHVLNKTALLSFAFPYVVLALLPIAYYLVMLNPSGVHASLFSHKSMVVAAFAGLSMLAEMSVLPEGKT